MWHFLASWNTSHSVFSLHHSSTHGVLCYYAHLGPYRKLCDANVRRAPYNRTSRRHSTACRRCHWFALKERRVVGSVSGAHFTTPCFWADIAMKFATLHNGSWLLRSFARNLRREKVLLGEGVIWIPDRNKERQEKSLAYLAPLVIFLSLM